MKKEFTKFPRSAKLYLISQFLLAGYYTWPFWYGFAIIHITPLQFGTYLAVLHIVGLIAEIPTGAFADTFGRKLSAMLGAFCYALAPLIVFIGGNFAAYMLSAIATGIGSAFISGSLESLVYDLPDMTSDIFKRVMIHDTYFWQSGLILSTALGGFMYQFNNPLPFVAEASSFVLAMLVIMQIATDKRIDATTPKHSVNSYLNTTYTGFMHLFKAIGIRWLIVFGISVNVLTWMGIEYINEAAMIHYGLAPELRGLLLSGAKVIALLLLNFLILPRVKTDKQKLTYLLISTLTVYGLYATGVIQAFLLAFVVFNLISSVQDNFIKPMLHDHIDSRWRATSISSYSFAANLLRAGAAIGIGVVIQTHGIVFAQRMLLLAFVVIGGLAYVKYVPKLSKQEDSTIS